MRHPTPRHNAPFAVVARALFFFLLSSIVVVHVEGRSCRREFDRTGICPQLKCTECQVTSVVGINGGTLTECARLGSTRCCKVAIDEEACLTNSFCEWDMRRRGGRCRRMRRRGGKKGSEDAEDGDANVGDGDFDGGDGMFGTITTILSASFGATTTIPGAGFGATTSNAFFSGGDGTTDTTITTGSTQTTLFRK